MNKLLIPILLLVFLFAQKGVDAQDRLFSQYYSAPLLLNPGLTGSFDGKYRIGTNYRDQWRTVLDAPYRTSSISLESKFPLQNVFKFIRKDNLALGLLFYSDKVGGVDFNTTQISLSIAYHKSLDDDNKHYLSIGFQGGIVQRNVNFEDFTFDDQFNGLDGYSFATGEVLPSNNFSFSDYSTGLNYSFSPNRKMRIFLGGSYQHIFAPEQTFYDTEDGFSNKLFSKYNAQVSFSYAFTNQFSVIPRALVALQGPHMEINAGSNFRLSISEYGGTALQFGTSYRLSSYESSGIGSDAFIVLLGLETGGALIGLSYDFNINDIATYRQGQRTFELSIAYIGEYDSETILCPKF